MINITRKQAEEVLNNWRGHLVNEEANGNVWNLMNKPCFKLQRDKFLAQFSDKPTPDEMLAEMREWAIENKKVLKYWEKIDNIFPNDIEIQIDKIYITKEGDNYREEAITEAYNRWLKIKGA